VSLLDRALAAMLPALPRDAVHLVARRYIAGTTLAECMDCVAALNAEGATATVDLLGEHVIDLAETVATRDGYLDVLRAIHERGLDATVSVKPTALGLLLDPATCEAHVRAVCEEARAHGTFVTIDMEDSGCTDRTIDLYLRVHRDTSNVGPVLQAALRRTADDVKRLAGPDLTVRLCKGIYREPVAIAFQDPDLIRQSYAWLLEELFARGASVGVATHDEALVAGALALVEREAVPRERFELQMLLGVTEPLRRRLIAEGHRLRVYVPFGEQWYEYSVRRLRENPAIAGHVARATFGRLLGRG
jgi:proline dehydrogenase